MALILKQTLVGAIAAGKQEWQTYLINWNSDYFAPAIAAAYQTLGTTPGSTKGSNSAKSSSRQAQLTEVRCPKCEWMMQKIPCRSKKLKADHFLKCSNSSCDTAMFWSDKKQGYELPYSKLQELDSSQKEHQAIATSGTPNPQPSIHTSETKSPSIGSNITQYSCPICSKPLELYEYMKDGEQKKMLRCSDASARRQDDHKKVAYFAVRGAFWSPTYGEISNQASVQKPTKSGSTGQVSKQRKFNKPVATKSVQVATLKASSPQSEEKCPCPVCGKPLELYEYQKYGQSKQMLRCSDASARKQDDHKNVAYFLSKGVFWSPQYGEISTSTS